MFLILSLVAALSGLLLDMPLLSVAGSVGVIMCVSYVGTQRRHASARQTKLDARSERYESGEY